MMDNLSKIEQIIYNSLLKNPFAMQGDDTPEETLLKIKERLSRKECIAIEDGGFVIMLEPENKYLGRVHFFSDNGTFNWLKSGNKIVKFIFDNFQFIKIYNMYGDRRMSVVGKRGGWKHEGTLEKAYWNGEKFEDLYISSFHKDDYHKLEKYS
jgi:hypothetical protein